MSSVQTLFWSFVKKLNEGSNLSSELDYIFTSLLLYAHVRKLLCMHTCLLRNVR